ncbi:HAMP domain-containing protein [Roseiconus nitratireducens]|uniref:histidine kinase n=1 Tax=Roseiconus nitratireducens TaxID=2605748 RepID=A0A5M6D9L1_9BACT|nr:HAMP domain-containing sensor histidine kinase [Roseiconus nitratireducens]KAA5542629.1 HAMP domain-containing protein [Roseiconus nitratireducens]
MRLAAKLILLFLVGLILIVTVFAVLTWRNDRRLAIVEHEKRAAELVAMLRPNLEDAWRRGDAGQVRRVLRETTRRIQRYDLQLITADGNAFPEHLPVDVITTRHLITTVVEPDASGRRRLATYVPLGDDNAAIEISSPDEQTQDRLRDSLIHSGIALLSVTLLSAVVVGVGGIYMVGQPLEQLIDKVHRIGKGDFDRPLQLNRSDELGNLGTAIDQMCEQLQHQRTMIEKETRSRIATEQQLRHADRLSTLGTLAAGMAHEIGTPLGVISGRAQLIASGDLPADQARNSARVIKEESDRISRIVRGLLDFARRGSLRRTSVNLRDLTRQTIELLEPLTSKSKVIIDLQATDPTLMSEIDANQMQQVLTNLLMNATEAMPSGGTVDVILDRESRVPQQSPDSRPEMFHRIDVIDRGAGIAEEDLEHLFEPFFTTKSIGKGTGLGLSIAYGIVHDHGGWIEVDSEPGRGSRFSVFLPVASQQESGT